MTGHEDWAVDGAPAEGPGPLDGVVVLDVTVVMAGSYCGLLLADMGADVIKVERTDIGDLTRWAGDGGVDAFRPLNRNKRGLALDLRERAGRDVLRRLAGSADVLVENHRPGSMDRLGLGYQDLAEVNPGLVYASISGFGGSGPYREQPGFDLMAQAMSGLMSVTGEAGGEPVKAGVPVADLNAAVFATLGVLSALIHRDRTGRGQLVDTSLLEASIAYTVWEAMLWFQAGVVAERRGSTHRLSAPYEAFPTADGHVAVAAPTPDQYAALAEAVDRPDLIEDPRFATPALRLANRAELAAELGPTFTGVGTGTWVDRLRDAGVPAAPVNRMDEVFEDPQVVHRRMVEYDEEGRPRLGQPVKLSATPWAVRRPAPGHGEHSREVLAEAGYGEDEVEALVQAGIVRST